MALGRLGSPDDGRRVMVECHDARGELRALLSFVPWGSKGLSPDLMRRDRDSDNGLVESWRSSCCGRRTTWDWPGSR
ncbi:phosphatidylglycerol lysyltransferase domain-containing protein [Streptomyces sp. NPDC057430]|uniref:phosphatidylglycerol lysyltransferase domain-containing protein n=1 Tax=Streptomyces sp. NPDC057430 TaxID=3346131 RepID=UPI0036B59E0B